MKSNIFLIKNISSLLEILNQMSNKEFSQSLRNLHGASIGQHARHIIEFVDCLAKIQELETICYDDRKRDVNLEQDLIAFLTKSNQLILELEQSRKNFPLKIRYYLGAENYSIAETNYSREELFVLDHTVHHLAIIKIGITENFSEIDVPTDFGFTASTIRAKSLIAASA